MGSGKGNPEFWVAVVKPGRVLFELSYPDAVIAKGALEKAIQKLPDQGAHHHSRGRVLRWRRPTRELAELDLGALVEELRATKQESLNLRFRNATGQLDNNAEIRKVRRRSRASTPTSAGARSPPPRAGAENMREFRRDACRDCCSSDDDRRRDRHNGRRLRATPGQPLLRVPHARSARATSCRTRWTRRSSSR
jgi:ribosomal protein L29